jgi:hypothetical protein
MSHLSGTTHFVENPDRTHTNTTVPQEPPPVVPVAPTEEDPVP